MKSLPTNSVEHSKSWQIKALLGLAQTRTKRSSFLPTEIGGRAELYRLLTELSKDTPQTGEALVATVCARDSTLPVLQKIKDLTKTLLTRAKAEPEQAAATLLYHASVAAALGRFGTNISSRDASIRLGLYEDLAVFLEGDPLGEVFRSAVEKLVAGNQESGN